MAIRFIAKTMESPSDSQGGNRACPRAPWIEIVMVSVIFVANRSETSITILPIQHSIKKIESAELHPGNG